MKPHEKHAALTDAFATADAATPRTKAGNASYGFSKGAGMPISPAKQASVNKAAEASAASRGARAEAKAQPAAPNVGQPKTTSTGGLGLAKPKKGLLSL